jgi:hypothetical protein
MLVGLFLFSGDQGGVEQKNRVNTIFYRFGSFAPREEKYLHDEIRIP